jgi:hypothetical protein
MHAACRELIKSFPAMKIFRFVVGTIVLVVMVAIATAEIYIMVGGTYLLVMLVCVARELKREEAENKRQAEMTRE